jgi:uncharacterized LabA/DUF88 family protein/cold shock CspA family protein
MAEKTITKIGVFYDGNYFFHISNYYHYVHARRSRISISGLHNFITRFVAEMLDKEPSLCQIVDAHFFRGRIPAGALENENQLYSERVFDDILMWEGVTTHYLPAFRNANGYREKGIDVWLALEALELNYHKRFDFMVFITADGDYLPLIRKVNTVGTKVILLSWDFEFVNDMGKRIQTKTSEDLIKEANFPLDMHQRIDARQGKSDPMIDGLFQQKAEKAQPEVNGHPMEVSTILNLKDGYGFIRFPPNNVFFHYTALDDGTDFNSLNIGDSVEFVPEQSDDGRMITKRVRKL